MQGQRSLKLPADLQVGWWGGGGGGGGGVYLDTDLVCFAENQKI